MPMTCRTENKNAKIYKIINNCTDYIFAYSLEHNKREKKDSNTFCAVDT